MPSLSILVSAFLVFNMQTLQMRMITIMTPVPLASVIILCQYRDIKLSLTILIVDLSVYVM